MLVHAHVYPAARGGVNLMKRRAEKKRIKFPLARYQVSTLQSATINTHVSYPTTTIDFSHSAVWPPLSPPLPSPLPSFSGRGRTWEALH